MSYSYVLRYHVIFDSIMEKGKTIWDVPFDTYLDHLADAKSLGLKVWITFDDGWDMGAITTKVYEVALKYGERVTVFPITKLVGRSGMDAGKTIQTKDRSFLSYDELRKLKGMGVEIGSHSRTHADLPGLAESHLHSEVVGSMWDLVEQFGGGVNTFCYPSGLYNDVVQRMVKEAGYKEALACEDGDGTNLAISRVGMYSRAFTSCIQEFNDGERGQRRRKPDGALEGVV